MRWSRRAGELVNAVPRGGRMMLVGVALIAALAVTWMAAVATVTGSAASAPAVAAGDGIPGRFESVPEPDADPAPGTESAPGGGSGAARYGPELAAPAPTPAGQGKQIAPPGDGGSGSPADPFGGATDRSVVRTARLELTVDDVPEVSGRVRAIAGGVGGFVASEQSVDKSASFTLRVPASRLDEVMGQLGGAGRVTARSEQAADVTGQVADLDGRLATARASVARVRSLLDRASTVGDVVMIESELTQREAALESLSKRTAALSNQVALSTLTVRLTPTLAAPPPAAGGFLAGLGAGWLAFLAAGGTLLTVIGAVLPFALLLALLAALGRAGRRMLHRRRPAGVAPPADGA
jgi:hypothetical protein